jgi:hypothetical protein
MKNDKPKTVRIELTPEELETIVENLTVALAGELPKRWEADTPSEALLGWHAYRQDYVSGLISNRRKGDASKGEEFNEAAARRFFEDCVEAHDRKAAVIERLLPALKRIGAD